MARMGANEEGVISALLIAKTDKLHRLRRGWIRGQSLLGVGMVIYADESYKLVGACFEVYNRMGCGFLEGVYQECLEIELSHREIPFVAQQELKLTYRDRELRQSYVPDFVCYEKIILEIKALSMLTDEHKSQVLNYLHATGMKLGLLVNFGHYPRLEYERVVLTEKI